MISYTNPDGYTFRVFSSCYVDWGLEITKDGEELFYNPHFLSSESYGFHWEDDAGNELDEGIPWADQEWIECLKGEADMLLECYLDDGSVGWSEDMNISKG